MINDLRREIIKTVRNNISCSTLPEDEYTIIWVSKVPFDKIKRSEVL